MVVSYPPMISGGYVYSFGSGYHGQLGLGDKKTCASPEVIEVLASTHLLVKEVSAGSHHCAAITIGKSLYYIVYMYHK
jgi:hypothetical protein